MRHHYGNRAGAAQPTGQGTCLTYGESGSGGAGREPLSAPLRSLLLPPRPRAVPGRNSVGGRAHQGRCAEPHGGCRRHPAKAAGAEGSGAHTAWFARLGSPRPDHRDRGIRRCPRGGRHARSCFPGAIPPAGIPPWFAFLPCARDRSRGPTPWHFLSEAAAARAETPAHRWPAASCGDVSTTEAVARRAFSAQRRCSGWVTRKSAHALTLGSDTCTRVKPESRPNMSTSFPSLLIARIDVAVTVRPAGRSVRRPPLSSPCCSSPGRCGVSAHRPAWRCAPPIGCPGALLHDSYSGGLAEDVEG